MAKVFLGTDTVLGRTVAVKVLAPQFVDDEGFVQRFRREAQAAASIGHQSIVSVFDTGSDDGVHFIVMEYVEGRTLAEILAGGGRILRPRDRHRDGCVPGARGRACAGRDPPRHQARQHHAQPARRGEGRGLRHRAGHHDGRHGRADRGDPRHGVLPVAGAGAGTARRRAFGHLLARMRADEMVTGRPPFLGDFRRGRVQAGAGAADAAVAAEPGRHGRPRRRDPAGARRTPSEPLPVGRGDARRPRTRQHGLPVQATPLLAAGTTWSWTARPRTRPRCFRRPNAIAARTGCRSSSRSC